jgi:hypothetical protein
MPLLQEVVSGLGSPVAPDGGWNIGHLGNLGVLLSCDGFSLRLDQNNLDLLFDFAEDGEWGELRDHDCRIIEVTPDTKSGIVLKIRDDIEFPYGLILDLDALKEMGIEQYEEDDGLDDTADPEKAGGENLGEPLSKFDDLTDDVTVSHTEFDPLEEGVKVAYRRKGKKIKRGFRVTSGFRKGRVVASAKSAFKPRVKASTRSKLKIAAKKKKFIRLLKGKMTRRKSASLRLKLMNKRIP